MFSRLFLRIRPSALDPGLQPARLGGLRLALRVRGCVPPGDGGPRLCVKVDFQCLHLFEEKSCLGDAPVLQQV